MTRILCTLALCALCLSAAAQQGGSRADLERRRQALIASLRETQAQLSAARKDTRASMSQLRALQAKLDARHRLIQNINQEMQALEGSIQATSGEVTSLQAQLRDLQMRYAQSIRYAYRHRRSHTMMAFLFSAQDFNDGVRRLRFLKKFRDLRLAQSEQIRRTQGQLQSKLGVLASERSQKNLLLSAEVQQRQVLQAEASETNKVVRELKGREAELTAQVASAQKATRQLDRAIQDAIRREIEIARRKAEEERKRQEAIAAAERKRREEEARRTAAATTASQNNGNVYGSGSNRVILSTPSSNNNNGSAATTRTPATGAAAASGTQATRTTTSSAPIAASAPRPRPAPARAPVSLNLTPEAAALSASFATNRGKLPWPVAQGTVTSSFGVHRHPVAERVMVENNGIDIQTSPGAPVRAVFDGTVSSVFFIPGKGQNVLVSHGDYFTVYAGLASVAVSKGQAVKTKQAIGTVGTNEEGLPVMNFQVWKGGTKMNPAGWIAQ